MLPPDALIQRWSVVALVLYALVMWAVLERTVERSLVAVRGVVKIDEGSYERYVHQMRPPSTAVQLAIFVGRGRDQRRPLRGHQLGSAAGRSR